MRLWKLSRTVAALVLALALVPGIVSAQDADTISISGTFYMDALQGTVGDDLAAVFANDNGHRWSLTLHGVSYSHDYWYVEQYDEYGGLVYFNEEYITSVHATSFEFQFFGADADALNQVVSSQLARGELTGDAFLELINGNSFDAYDGWAEPYAVWRLGLAPLDYPATGVSFSIGYSSASVFSADENDYPIVEPQRLYADSSYITDYRPGNSGALVSYDDFVDLGTSVPPIVPPPPPPTLSIADGSAPQPKKGTASLVVTVTLSRSSTDAVTVHYATSNGTAIAGQDYIAASGDLTFSSGQTSRTITLTIKANPKRTSNKTFSVTLSNATGATIEKAVATVTILK